MISALPDKMYLKIGEVSAATGLPASVLRYWESEFSALKPKKSSSGQRLYTKKDVEQVAEIQKLLYAEKLTIEGARKRMELKNASPKPEVAGHAVTETLRQVREELLTLRNMM